MEKSLWVTLSCVFCGQEDMFNHLPPAVLQCSWWVVMTVVLLWDCLGHTNGKNTPERRDAAHCSHPQLKRERQQKATSDKWHAITMWNNFNNSNLNIAKTKKNVKEKIKAWLTMQSKQIILALKLKFMNNWQKIIWLTYLSRLHAMHANAFLIFFRWNSYSFKITKFSVCAQFSYLIDWWTS